MNDSDYDNAITKYPLLYTTYSRGKSLGLSEIEILRKMIIVMAEIQDECFQDRLKSSLLMGTSFFTDNS